MTSNRRNLSHIPKPLICIYTNQNRNEFAIGTKSILQLYETLPLILNNNNDNNPVLILFSRIQQVYFQSVPSSIKKSRIIN